MARKVKTCQYDIFENTSNSVVALHEDEVNEISVLIQEHLTSLGKELDSYFPDISDLDCQLIRNPFKSEPRSLPDELQDEFVDLVSDSTAKDSFDSFIIKKILVSSG